MAPSKSPLPARMHWIPAKKSRLQLEQTKYFAEMMSSGSDSGQLNLQFYRLFNATMPLFLPARYYNMDCKALHANSKNCQYWANAAQQVVHNQALGLLFLKIAVAPKSLINLSHLPSLPLSSFTTAAEQIKARSFFRKDIEQCETSAEFLLEPWLLVQLAWNPLMFHQWLVAVTAEIYKFEKELAEFYHWPVAQQQIPTLSSLWSITDQLRQISMLGFLHLCSTFELCPSEESQEIVKDIVQNIVEALPLLKFMLSKEAMKVVKSLKKLLWTPAKSGLGPINPMSMRVMKRVTLEDINSLYHPKFWKEGKFGEVFGNVLNKGVQADPSKNTKENIPTSWGFDETWNEKKKKVYKDVNWEDIKTLIDKEILQKEVLEDTFPVTKSSFLDLVVGDMYFVYYYNMYMEHNYGRDGVHKSDHGAIFDILVLNCEAKRAYALAAITSHLHYLFYKKTNVGLVLTPFNCSNLKKPMKMKEAKDVLKNVETEVEKKQTFAMLMKELGPCCRKAINPNEKCPDINKLGPNQVAFCLETRIKRIAFHMIQSFYASLNGTKKFYEEIQFVQFILPCYVASFLDLCKDSSVSREKTAWYLRYVHELIKSFEEKENEETANGARFQSFCCSYLTLAENIPTSIFWKAELIQCVISRAMMGSFDLKNELQTSVPNLMKSKGFDVLTILQQNKEMVTKGMDHQNICSSIMGGWSNQLHKYLCRMLNVLRIVAPVAALENNRLVDATITCQMMVNYISQNFAHSMAYPQIHVLMDQASDKVRQLCGLTSQPKFKGSMAHLSSRKALLETKILSAEHLLGIILHYCVERRKSISVPSTCSFRSGHFFIHDPTETAFISFASRDWVKMKLLMSWMLGGDAHGRDKSVVPFDFAKFAAPYSYSFVLQSVKGKVLQMSEPAELTIVPLVHCRWCGLVDGVLTMCKVCVQNMDYPDKNWFCSDECEKRGMDKVHNEEHARDLVIKIGITDKVKKLQKWK